MNAAMLKWIAGVASVLCVMAVVAMLNMWSDSRTMKVTLDDIKANAIKAERIATLEAQVKALEATDVKHDNSISALWRARGSRESQP